MSTTCVVRSLELLSNLKTRYQYAPQVHLDESLSFKRLQHITAQCDKAFRAQCQLFDEFRDIRYLSNTSGNATTLLYVARKYGQIQQRVDKFSQLIADMKVKELSDHYNDLFVEFSSGMLTILKQDVEIMVGAYIQRRKYDIERWPTHIWDPIDVASEQLLSAYHNGSKM